MSGAGGTGCWSASLPGRRGGGAGAGTVTHRFFRVAHSRDDLIGQRDAIAAWARLSYGWMGRSPDYKASLIGEFHDGRTVKDLMVLATQHATAL